MFVGSVKRGRLRTDAMTESHRRLLSGPAEAGAPVPELSAVTREPGESQASYIIVHLMDRGAYNVGPKPEPLLRAVNVDTGWGFMWVKMRDVVG